MSLLSQSLLVFFLCISRAQTMHLERQSLKSIILFIHWAPFWEKGDLARRITLPAEPTFCCSCKQFATFARKCRKSWLPQGSSGWRVILLFGTSFLRINKAFLYVLNYYWVIFWLFFRRIFVSCFACWNQISTRTCCSKMPLWTCCFAIDSFFSHSNENSLTKKC